MCNCVSNCNCPTTCGCSTTLSSVCVKYEGLDLGSLGAVTDGNLESILINLDSILLNLYTMVAANPIGINVGGGIELFKPLTADFKTFTDTASIIASNPDADTVAFAISQVWIDALIDPILLRITNVEAEVTTLNTFVFGTGGSANPGVNGTGLSGVIYGTNGTPGAPGADGVLVTLYGSNGDPNAPNGGITQEGSLEIEDESTTVGTTAKKLNFIGTGVTAVETVPGSNNIDITVTQSAVGITDVEAATDTNFTGKAVGDIQYWDGTDWVNLAVGATSGHVLKSNGSAAAPSYQAEAGGGAGSGDVVFKSVSFITPNQSWATFESDLAFGGGTNITETYTFDVSALSATEKRTISNVAIRVHDYTSTTATMSLLDVRGEFVTDQICWLSENTNFYTGTLEVRFLGNSILPWSTYAKVLPGNTIAGSVTYSYVKD